MSEDEGKGGYLENLVGSEVHRHTQTHAVKGYVANSIRPTLP